MSLIDSPALRLLGASLDVNAFRQGLISSNIANIDTPGYRTRDIDFRKTLSNALEEVEASRSPAAHKVEGLIERPDGNNVNADREGLLLAQTQLRFTLSAQLLKGEFHRIASAINGGAADRCATGKSVLSR
jgi:flagellar basal-body rod protein FlgB